MTGSLRGRCAGCRRKSPQWFGLLRPHAQIIASDDYYIELFRQHCVARRLVKGKCVRHRPLLRCTVTQGSLFGVSNFISR